MSTINNINLTPDDVRQIADLKARIDSDDPNDDLTSPAKVTTSADAISSQNSVTPNDSSLAAISELLKQAKTHGITVGELQNRAAQIALETCANPSDEMLQEPLTPAELELVLQSPSPESLKALYPSQRSRTLNLSLNVNAKNNPQEVDHQQKICKAIMRTANWTVLPEEVAIVLNNVVKSYPDGSPIVLAAKRGLNLISNTKSLPNSEISKDGRLVTEYLVAAHPLLVTTDVTLPLPGHGSPIKLIFESGELKPFQGTATDALLAVYAIKNSNWTQPMKNYALKQLLKLEAKDGGKQLDVGDTSILLTSNTKNVWAFQKTQDDSNLENSSNLSQPAEVLLMLEALRFYDKDAAHTLKEQTFKSITGCMGNFYIGINGANDDDDYDDDDDDDYDDQHILKVSDLNGSVTFISNNSDRRDWSSSAGALAFAVEAILHQYEADPKMAKKLMNKVFQQNSEDPTKFHLPSEDPASGRYSETKIQYVNKQWVDSEKQPIKDKEIMAALAIAMPLFKGIE